MKDIIDMDFTELHVERSRLLSEQDKLRDRQKVVEDLIYTDHLENRGKVELDIDFLRKKAQNAVNDLKRKIDGQEGVAGCAMLIAVASIIISVLAACKVFG